MPAVLLWNRHKFCPCPWAIDADAKGVWTKVPSSCQTIAAVSTGDVSLTHHEVAARKSFHVVTDGVDNTGELVTYGHRHRNGFLRPVIPVINVHVGTTDRRFQHPNQHIVAANFRDWDVLQPQTWLAFGLHNR